MIKIIIIFSKEGEDYIFKPPQHKQAVIKQNMMIIKNQNITAFHKQMMI